jgi:hypothetical protein
MLNIKSVIPNVKYLLLIQVRYDEKQREVNHETSEPERIHENRGHGNSILDPDRGRMRCPPANPAPLAETSCKIEPCHFPPFKKKEEYRERKKKQLKRQ